MAIETTLCDRKLTARYPIGGQFVNLVEPANTQLMMYDQAALMASSARHVRAVIWAGERAPAPGRVRAADVGGVQ